MYKSYIYLRPIVIFAGILGVLQGLTWIAMSIVGIVAFYCGMDFSGHANTIGALTEITFFRMYFQGSCFQPDMPTMDTSITQELGHMPASDFHAFMWVYLIMSFAWVVSSITLFTNVTFKYIQYANIFLYIWIVIVMCLSLIDLGLGIAFGLDYEAAMLLAHQQQIIDALEVGQFGQNMFVLMSAQAASGIMMAMSFRGYVLWVINVALAIYLFIETFRIMDYNKARALAGTANLGYNHSITQREPIQAYGWNNSRQPQSMPWQPTEHDTPIRGDPRQRSQSLSSQYDDRNRRHQGESIPQAHLQQPPPPARRRDDDVQLRNSTAIAREITDRNSLNRDTRPFRNEQGLPAPDYSPPMPRANPFDNRPPLRSALRNSRYQ